MRVARAIMESLDQVKDILTPKINLQSKAQSLHTDQPSQCANRATNRVYNPDYHTSVHGAGHLWPHPGIIL